MGTNPIIALLFLQFFLQLILEVARRAYILPEGRTKHTSKIFHLYALPDDIRKKSPGLTLSEKVT